jgi:hypothetical protein
LLAGVGGLSSTTRLLAGLSPSCWPEWCLSLTQAYKLILRDGTTANATVTEIVAPAYDPISTLQTNQDYVALNTTADVAQVVYIAPATFDPTTKADGFVYEDSDSETVGVAVVLEGAKLEQLLGVELFGFGAKVIDGLVFFYTA